jgi:hypothetical protein
MGETNPLLEAMRDDLYVFSDVISPHSHTTPTLKKISTVANSYDPKAWNERPTLFDIYRAARYTTYWVSNQEAYGIWANITSAIGGMRSSCRRSSKRTKWPPFWSVIARHTIARRLFVSAQPRAVRLDEMPRFLSTL